MDEREKKIVEAMAKAMLEADGFKVGPGDPPSEYHQQQALRMYRAYVAMQAALYEVGE